MRSTPESSELVIVGLTNWAVDIYPAPVDRVEQPGAKGPYTDQDIAFVSDIEARLQVGVPVEELFFLGGGGAGIFPELVDEGRHIKVFSPIGADIMGEKVGQLLAPELYEKYLIAGPNYATPTSIISREISSIPGQAPRPSSSRGSARQPINECFKPHQIEAFVQNADVVVLPSTNPEMVRMVGAVISNQTILAVNPGGRVCRERGADLLSALDSVDAELMLSVNESEGHNLFGPGSAQAIIRRARRYVRHVQYTVGEKGMYFASQDWRDEGVIYKEAVPVAAEDELDTTGAGEYALGVVLDAIVKRRKSNQPQHPQAFLGRAAARSAQAIQHLGVRPMAY